MKTTVTIIVTEIDGSAHVSVTTVVEDESQGANALNLTAGPNEPK